MKEKELFEKYVSETKQAGGSITHIKYGLKIFFKYIEETGLDFLKLRLRGAQEFQVYLTTQSDEGGSIRYAKASVLNIVGCASKFYEFLRKKKYIYTNPFDEVDRVRRSDSLPRNILNEENMDKFLKHLKNFMQGRTLIEKRQLYKTHVIAELMYSTGARVNEIGKLKAADVDFIRGTVTVHDSKTGKKRETILNSFAEKVLQIYINEMREYVLTEKSNPESGYLFGGKTNLRTWLNTMLNRESQKLDLGTFTSHNFRHAVGYHLLRAGCDIRFIQEILGHKELHTTQVYTKVDKEDLKNVIDNFHPRMLRKGKSDENI